ncbi:uncharacterized protein Z520_04582 [Fonsecaea multimorphosa CBS 102226]|uniref:Uncharacterized protein n=1 Tax=Fonsecaea multimorphosa CBS 102226 TaxID=1442371 RepID=A0A0D2K9Y3_9EURO|nr:uncharacterized protein Z520_04582 [Fonsecaea multimorphosa CBS 102226]KIX99944.1 hypothetical protein Z520_04582 [Fonsecaea multimorphosa CBS 102226]OAL26419.1 hypothetical protein AYO22_04337 [Fonsecaea multimorphosa]
MPVYLVHGFRWPREGFTGIRVHAVLHNLDDCSAEYIQNANSREELLRSFRKIYPDIMRELDHTDTNPASTRRLEFIEQYNPDDLESPYAVSQPYAFVGDKVVMIAAGPGMGLTGPGVAQVKAYQHHVLTEAEKKQRATTLPMSKSAPFNSPAYDTAALSVNLDEVVADGPGLTNKAWEALADLRDKIAEGEKIGWWVVYNGDPERSFDDVEEDDDDDEQEDEEMEDVGEEDEDAGTPVACLPSAPPLPPTAASASTSAPSPASTRGQGHRPTPSDSLPIPTSTMTTSDYPKSPPPVAPMLAQAQHIASQMQQPHQHQEGGSPGLTALPVRLTPPSSIGSPAGTTRPPANTAPPATSTSETGTGKGKQKERDFPEEPAPAKAKETAKSQSLRKKFFGRRG